MALTVKVKWPERWNKELRNVNTISQHQGVRVAALEAAAPIPEAREELYPGRTAGEGI
jgi:hypothetical protein